MRESTHNLIHLSMCLMAKLTIWRSIERRGGFKKNKKCSAKDYAVVKAGIFHWTAYFAIAT